MNSLLVHSWELVLLFALAAGIRSAFSRWRGRNVLPFACAALGAHAALYWSYTVDDTFITLRFARSWLEGLGPVYQAGEHVEGFTSFAWMGLIALAGKLGLDLTLAARALGLLAAAAALPAVFAVARRLTDRPHVALAATLLLAMTPLYAAWSVAGMDAPLFAAVVAWAVWAHVEDRHLPGEIPLDAVLFGIAVWIRPEAFAFGALAWLATLFDRRPRLASRALRWALSAIAVAAPFWIWRWRFYGEFLPNTFYAKMPDWHLRIAAGGTALLDFARESGPWLWLPIVASLVALRHVRASRLPWMIVGGFPLYVLWTGGDVLHLRFFVHVLPLVLMIWAAGVAVLIAPLERMHWKMPAPVRVALVVVLVAGATVIGARRDARALTSRLQFGPGYVVNNARNVREVGLPLGLWLRENVPGRYRVAAWDIGGLGYASRLSIVDLYGLTDAGIAHLIHEDAPVEARIRYLLDLKPELLVMYARVNGPDWGWIEPAADSVMAHYHYHSLWQASSSGYWLVLLARDDIELPPPPAVAMASPARMPRP